MLSVLWSKKTRAILAFLREGSAGLSKEYSKQEYYTKEQISWMVVSLLPKYTGFIEYALFIHMKPEIFDDLNMSLGGIFSTNDIQKDILHILNEIKDKTGLDKYSRASHAKSMRL